MHDFRPMAMAGEAARSRSPSFLLGAARWPMDTYSICMHVVVMTAAASRAIGMCLGAARGHGGHDKMHDCQSGARAVGTRRSCICCILLGAARLNRDFHIKFLNS